ncbi:MAG: hypothetical protein KAI99_12815, partial [Cyclobacteriaceae bacterium]|nr:hypothetical protein [Cyclobacteriaceae bacterium]
GSIPIQVAQNFPCSHMNRQEVFCLVPEAFPESENTSCNDSAGQIIWVSLPYCNSTNFPIEKMFVAASKFLHHSYGTRGINASEIADREKNNY